MENVKLTTGRNAINFGLMLGLALIVLNLFFYVLNVDINSSLKYLTYVIIAGFIIYGTFYYRDKHNNGFLSYGNSFLSGLLIALYASIFFGIYWYLFIKFFDHSFMVKVREIAQEAMLKKMQGMSDEQIEVATKWQHKFTTPFFMAFFNLFGQIFWSTIMSLIIAIFLKKEDKSIPVNNEQLNPKS